MSNKIYCKIFVDLYFMKDMDKNGILEQISDYLVPQTNYNRTFKEYIPSKRGLGIKLCHYRE